MSAIDQSVEKEAISDYSEIFQEDIDEVKEQLKELSDGFLGLNLYYQKAFEKQYFEDVGLDAPDEVKKWIIKNQYNPKGKRIWQYEYENQTDFIINKFKISSKLDAVFPVVKDINEIFTISQKELQQQGEQATQAVPQNVINVVPPAQQKMVQTPSFLSRLRKSEEGGLPKSLEDAWNRTQEWQITTMNIPNLWAKFVDWHEKGCIRQDVFEEGMESYMKIERWYLQAVLEPNITKMVQRGLMISKDLKLKNLKDIYSGTLEMKKNQDQFAMFAQMAGGGQKS